LGSLNILTLDDTAITDDGLKHLVGLRELKSLYLRRSNVTRQGIETLAHIERVEAFRETTLRVPRFVPQPADPNTR
jgi:hypothetical protein